MKDVGGVGETRSSEGRTDRRMEGQTEGQMDEGHSYSPPPPTSGDNNVAAASRVHMMKRYCMGCLKKYIYILERNTTYQGS